MGAAEGLNSRFAAEQVQAKELILIDALPAFMDDNAPCRERYWKLNIEAPDMEKRLAGKFDGLFSYKSFHELHKPRRTLTRVLRLLARNPKGFLCVSDHTEQFWDLDPRNNPWFTPDQIDHFKQDQRLVRQVGLATDVAIQEWWLTAARDAELPGQLELEFMTTTSMYVARWSASPAV